MVFAHFLRYFNLINTVRLSVCRVPLLHFTDRENRTFMNKSECLHRRPRVRLTSVPLQCQLYAGVLYFQPVDVPIFGGKKPEKWETGPGFNIKTSVDLSKKECILLYFISKRTCPHNNACYCHHGQWKCNFGSTKTPFKTRSTASTRTQRKEGTLSLITPRVAGQTPPPEARGATEAMGTK